MTINEPLNAQVQDLLQAQIRDGRQLGVQVCAYQGGQRIVDTWAGMVGPGDSRPVQADTLFNCFSTTKGVAATALHILADRGQIEYEQPVAKYWPEFAANGKGSVTVAQAMSHQAGLHAVPTPFTTDFITNWNAGLDWVANGTPAWEPGSATGYHAVTYAWVVGGIVQGATGRHIKDVIAEEIAKPLGIENQMFVGIPDGVEHRLASLQPPDGGLAGALPIPPDHDFFKAMPAAENSDVDYNDIRVRKACVPSANGHFNARALARMYAVLANGGELDGVRLLSKERIGEMQRIIERRPDRVLFGPIRKGVGFMMGGEMPNLAGQMVVGVFGPRETAFGHSGAGGSTAFCDPEAGLSIAVTINQMQNSLQGEGPTVEICHLIREGLGAA